MNVPKLRFKEFNDVWEEKKLKNIVNFSKGNILSKNDLDENGKYPCILYGQLYTKYKEVIREIFSRTNNDSSNIVKSKIGDVLIPSSGETPIDISTSSCLMLDNILVGGDINVLSPKENCNGRFLSYMINNNKKIEIAKIAQGHSIVHLYNDNLKDIIIKMPSLKEQEQIANVLELLDKKIELQSKKIEALKLYKKNLIKKLIFSIKDKNFYSLGELEQNKSLELFRGNVIPKNINGKYPVYSSSTKNNGLFCYSNNYMFDEELITWSIDGGGDFFYRKKHKFSVTNVSGYIKIYDKNINMKYLFCYLDYLHSFKKFDYQTKAHPSVIKNMYKVCIPSITVQNKISKSYDILSKKIKLEEEKLFKLESLKKGLMQNMFV